MNITLVNGNIKSTPAMVAHATTKLQSALGRFADRVREVRVHVIDTNGPRGGVDKICAIHAHIANAPTIIVTHAATDYYAAVNAAAQRLKATLARKLHKRNTRIPRA